MLGTGFGVGCALFLNSALSTSGLPFSWSVASQAPNLSFTLVEKEVAELSTAKGIDVMAVAMPPKDGQSMAQSVPASAAPALPPEVAPPAPLDMAIHTPPAVAAPVVAAVVSDTPTATELAATATEAAAPLEAAIAPESIPDPQPAANQVLALLEETKPVQLLGAKDEAVASDPKATTAVADAQPQPAPNVYPLMLDLKVSNGDTLMNILTDTGVSYQEAHDAVDSLGKIYNPKRLDIGQNVSVVLSKGDGVKPVITSMEVPISATSTVHVTRQGVAENVRFDAKEIKAEVFSKSARAGGRINSSLYETGMESGIPANVLNEMINAYSYDVDFQRDIHSGDNVDVVYEKLQTKDGTVAGSGHVLFADLSLSGKHSRFYRFADKSGNADYYNEKGESIRKAMLRTPINGAKITSSFGMRNHPILGYSKMHRGVDFGAPTGTPIYAAGDGTVEFVGKKGGYGNYLSIQHDKKYASAYGHISRFASGMVSGKKVKQGQIIAYVGATGMATGPHLHYEILVNHTQVNPSGIKFKTGNVLQGKDLASFRKSVAQIQALMSQPKKTQVASR